MASSSGVITDEYFKTGALVEISSNEEGFRGSFYLGTVVRPPGNAERRTDKVLVEYNTITEETDLVDLRPPPPTEVRMSYNISDFVDAYYNERWWEGLITGVKKNGKYSVFFRGTKELIDFKASELRLHREWVYGKWVPPVEQVQSASPSEKPLSLSGVKSKKQKTEHEFGVGANVEVRSDEEGYQGAWFAATVLKKLSERKYLVEYQNFRNDEGDDAKLTEKVYSQYIRPCPPDVECVDSFAALQEVDALYVDAWWVGKIDKVLEDDKYCVYFNITGKKLIFKHSDLRVHHEWIDGKWVVSSKIPQSKLETVGGLVLDRRCAQCQVRKTSQWRTGLLARNTLCNTCGVQFKSDRVLPEYRPEKSKPLRMKPLSLCGVNPKRRKIEHEFSVGANVEVNSDEKGYKGAWYVATVLENLKDDKCLVEYQNIRNDDGEAKLTEKINSEYIRPCPPDLKWVDSFRALQEVDAFYVDAWWVGEIDEVLEDDKYCVYFKITGKKLIFKHSELRVHQELRGGKWIVASKIPQKTKGDLVSGRRCTHCQVQETPQWRAGPLGRNTLCNACGVRFMKGRLFPEYRPASSPTFSSEVHSNSHQKVLEMRQRRSGQTQSDPASTELPKVCFKFDRTA